MIPVAPRNDISFDENQGLTDTGIRRIHGYRIRYPSTDTDTKKLKNGYGYKIFEKRIRIRIQNFQKTDTDTDTKNLKNGYGYGYQHFSFEYMYFGNGQFFHQESVYLFLFIKIPLW